MSNSIQSMKSNGEGSNTGDKTLGQYLLDCLKCEGITEIFGVPGDYNFTLLDTLEREKGIRFVNGRNELNAGYAADSYARLKGVSALITTFGVGEMSACNAIAGSYSENVPVIHIVGSPKTQVQQAHKLMHHTLHDGNYDVFRSMYESITAYTAVLTPENAAIEIPAAIRIAKEKKKPVYLVVAIDLVMKPVLQRESQDMPLKTNAEVLKAASEHAKQLLEASQHPVILSDWMVQRYGLSHEVEDLAQKLNIPMASLQLGKSGVDETHPLYMGMYGGALGSSKVRDVVEQADCVLAMGLIWSDSNSGHFSGRLDTTKTIIIEPNSVKIGEAVYLDIKAEDMLHELLRAEQSKFATKKGTTYDFPYDMETGEPEDLLVAESYYPRIQRMLREQDIVVAETGTFMNGISQLRLPTGANYIAQAGWESIGYATPAAFGACIAAPSRRVLLFTGDGSLQLTVQEISSMLANQCRPIIFILNNDGYTIEKYLNVKTDNQRYNEIPMWSYTKLTEAFGGQTFTVKVQTNGELDQAIRDAEVQSQERLCVIEMIAKDPMDAPDYLRRTREFLEEQEKKQS
ncbi:indolepyruvate decarboxylase [Paenibacillus shirakamiensis]|uniref:Alpha-keto-acid decarboxylase n=1 Tax=Paenibacillus shirakamiensis TaxID=1265935 RepID=A0ABS4JLQ1_9BACL|nr:thiamine pyrophosphate-binding protein [Paenibacillus shirakamiensis]MBP2001524.1 indolepyruvate decarboxylase [Paenibacillus shirakamiensis]